MLAHLPKRNKKWGMASPLLVEMSQTSVGAANQSFGPWLRSRRSALDLTQRGGRPC
jgi:hypothetical protein